MLERVLGLVPAGQDVMAEREQAAGVAIVDRLEGRVVTGPDSGDESVVVTAEHPPAQSGPASLPAERGGRHGASMPTGALAVAEFRSGTPARSQRRPSEALAPGATGAPTRPRAGQIQM